jgi:flagellar protein FliS
MNMMNTGNEAAMQAYQQIGNRSDVETATPHRLIQLMMERVLTKIAMARGHMDRNAVAEKGRHIGDAIDIITVLQASLNDKPDRRLARNFDALYDYMTRRLVEANLMNNAALLDEVTALMRELKDAWDAIGDQADDD